MGAFLDKPVVNKVSGNGQLAEGIAYGYSTMQGWRTSQEDAHACAPNFDANQPDRHLFAVFDGHGGAEVALYLAKHLPQYLLETDTYQSGDFEQALKDAFLGLDAKLLQPEVAAVLKSLAKSKDDDSESDQEAMAEEASALREEASMPLDRLLQTINAARRQRRLRAEQAESVDAAVAENENNENTEREAAAAADSAAPSTADSAANGNGVNGASEAAAVTASNDEGAGTSNADAKAEAKDDDKDSADADDEDKDYVPGETEEEEEEEDDEEGAEGDGEDEEGEEDDDDDEEDSEESEESEEEYEVIMPTGDDPGVDSGTTAVVALLVGDRLFVANAGDSRAVLSDAGVAVDMSVDHKPEDEAERKRIEAAGGHVTKEGRVNGGLNLSRAIGDHAYKQNAELTAAKQIISPLPDVRSVTIADSHRFLLLACDGIWNSMSSQEAVDFCEKRLSSGLSPEQVCEALFDHCLAPDAEESDGTGCDNMTAVLVCFRGVAEAVQQQQQLASGRKRQLSATGESDAKLEASAAAGAEDGKGGESESKRAKEG